MSIGLLTKDKRMIVKTNARTKRIESANICRYLKHTHVIRSQLNQDQSTNVCVLLHRLPNLENISLFCSIFFSLVRMIFVVLFPFHFRQLSTSFGFHREKREKKETKNVMCIFMVVVCLDEMFSNTNASHHCISSLSLKSFALEFHF